MVFSSLLFLFRFLPAVLILYYIAPRKLRNVILLLFSLFLCVGRTEVCISDAFTITMDFCIGKGIDKAKGRQSEKGEAFSYDFNPCGSFHPWIFKYADFLIGTVNTLTGAGIPHCLGYAADRYFFFYVSDNVIHD